MNVFRIAKKEFITDLSGTGAQIYGGRWNKKGTSLIYTSESRSLATLELLVHTSPAIVPDDLIIATIAISNNIKSRKIHIHDLPTDWRNNPAPFALAEIGSRWAKSNDTLLLVVPSAIIPHEHNILINPLHPEIKYAKIVEEEKMQIDQRLA